MRTYTDKRGGLKVDKYESNETLPDDVKKSVPRRKKAVYSEKSDAKKITAQQIVETAESYQIPQFTHNLAVNGGSECVFCGVKTAFDNRHVCIECWKKYKDDLFEGIKQIVSDVDISIE